MGFDRGGGGGFRGRGGGGRGFGGGRGGGRGRGDFRGGKLNKMLNFKLIDPPSTLIIPQT